MRFVFKMMAACAILVATFSSSFATDAKVHRVTIQVDQNDPAVMNLALNNATNIMDAYKAKGEDVEIELVAYGPGLNMFRDDTSPVKDRLKQISALSFPSRIKFSACNVTKEGMEKREGHPITLVPEAQPCAIRRDQIAGITGKRLELSETVIGAGPFAPTMRRSPVSPCRQMRRAPPRARKSLTRIRNLKRSIDTKRRV